MDFNHENIRKKKTTLNRFMKILFILKLRAEVNATIQDLVT
jgi:hypothetical protein